MSSRRFAITAPQRRSAMLVLGLASSAFFLWIVLRDADLNAVWRALRGAELGWMLVAALAIQCVYVAQAARWRLVADTHELTISRFYALVLAGIGANNVLPLRVGDLLRARWLASSAEIPNGRALGTVFRDRVCDVLILVVALSASLLIVGDPTWVARIALGGVALLVVVAVAVVSAIVYTRARPRARRGVRSRLRQLLRDALDEVASPIGRRQFVGALALSVAAWGAWAVAAGLVCNSLGITISPVELVFVTSVINLGVVIPSSPGFVGTYQWLAVSSLGVVSVGGDVAIAFSLLMQAVWFVPTTIVGGAIAFREVRRDPIRNRVPVSSGELAADERS